uniref:rhamnogalacturonan endolyase n=1 Tax=Solanum tuberosum TaxID=4113 RepID=A0A109NGZ2_SOLTU|nr:putative lyase [Solanum tuberosum]
MYLVVNISEDIIEVRVINQPILFLLGIRAKVTMSNGIVNVTLSIPYGLVTSISYGGVNNLLATQNVEKNRGFLGNSFEVIMDTENQAEISFKKKYKLDVLRSYYAQGQKRVVPQESVVDDKYFYATDNKDDRVHGWVSSTNPPVGFWMIIPNDEFRTGGPYKQDLTSHVGQIVLSIFVSRHFAGDDLVIKFQQGEPWKKVIGPVFLYLNSNSSAMDNPTILWDDAKRRMNQEVANWPYDFPVSEEYIKSNQRGIIRGQLLVNDSTTTLIPASNGYIGLAPPGDVGSWQRENKGYQFWTKTDAMGNFTIENVISGTYNLYATVPGIIGDYKYTFDVQVTPGSSIELGSLVYNPPRNGATLWEIGVPDRIAAEFFVPTPPLEFNVHIYQNNFESIFRQYGLWKQYSVLYPENDLVYNVGTSNYSKDWFFAHVTRNIGNKTYISTTWKIIFNLEIVDNASNYTLQMALAAAQRAELQVRFNDEKVVEPHFTTGKIGGDNAIARHGIHGLYFLYSIEVKGNLLVNGTNTIFLTQAIATNPFQGVMYDYLRLEGPHQ